MPLATDAWPGNKQNESKPLLQSVFRGLDQEDEASISMALFSLAGLLFVVSLFVCLIS